MEAANVGYEPHDALTAKDIKDCNKTLASRRITGPTSNLPVHSGVAGDQAWTIIDPLEEPERKLIRRMEQKVSVLL
ncbi:hypothetical protein Nepgr_031494 [Nepenthes gracilis]|uniref:Uncharacterized protein n=1 Tax=Nepenthes gracilis TaxID=150966 RepID=A0AAD3TI95_NEPGR|nr:hypothetical protein Nepgr_031494 [Nepenthes gracilis]